MSFYSYRTIAAYSRIYGQGTPSSLEMVTEQSLTSEKGLQRLLLGELSNIAVALDDIDDHATRLVEAIKNASDAARSAEAVSHGVVRAAALATMSGTTAAALAKAQHGLSWRAKFALDDAYGSWWLDEVHGQPFSKLRNTKGCGVVTIAEIVTAMESCGLKLAGSESWGKKRK